MQYDCISDLSNRFELEFVSNSYIILEDQKKGKLKPSQQGAQAGYVYDLVVLADLCDDNYDNKCINY